MFFLILSFCLIPAGELALMSPRIARSIAKGKKTALDTIKKGRELAKKRTLTEAEKAIVKEADELMSELSKNATKIAKATQKNFATKFIANVIAKGGKAILGTALLLSKMSWAIGRPFVLLGGIYYTYDEIYLALYGTDEQKMQLRNNSGFQTLIKYLKLVANQEKVINEASVYIQENSSQIAEHSGDLVTVDHEKQEENIQNFQQATVESLKKQQEEKERSPSFELVLSKKIDPRTEQPYAIREGLKGASVGKIQQMLEKLGYGETLRGYDSNEKKKAVDYDFGQNTYDAVGLFQANNNLKFTGIVDYETLKTLQIKFKEVENTNEKKDTN
jgi:murein L,D-transpeptidase YcbB/YkuD